MVLRMGYLHTVCLVRHLAGYMLWLGLSSPRRVWGTLNDTQKRKKESDKKMNTKMAAIFLTLMLALGATGLAAAWWTAELKVTGTVTTGTFGMEWSLWKWETSGDSKDIITGTGVALADYIGTHPQTLAIELYNVYPCTDLKIYGDIHYYGTVPGIIKSIDMEGTLNTVALLDIPDWMFIKIGIWKISPDLTTQRPLLTEGSTWTLPALTAELEGTQWHESYKIKFLVYIHWIETDMTFVDPWGVTQGPFGAGIEVPQDAKLEFTLTFDVVQYNMPP